MKSLKQLIILGALHLAALVSTSSFAATEPRLVPSVPTINATGYILLDVQSGTVLAEKNADETLPPASLTKMMTSYLVAREMSEGRIQPETMIPISVNAWKMQGSKMFIREGTEVKAEDLVRGIIIQSGNDASVAMAEFIAGSEDAFADFMTQMAEHLGMTNTNYRNATGWPAEGHYTSARDLSVLAKHIISDYPEHYAIYKEKSFVFNGITQSNRNRLLWLDKSVDGMKTGHTEEAGYCLVASAKRSDMRLVSVVLGTESDNARAKETQKLLAYGFRNFETHKLYSADDVINEPQVWKGTSQAVKLGLDEGVYLTIPRGKHEELQATLDVDEFIEAPITLGQKLGTLKVVLEGEVLLEKPVVAKSAVEEAGFFARIKDSIVLFFKRLIGSLTEKAETQLEDLKESVDAS